MGKSFLKFIGNILLLSFLIFISQSVHTKWTSFDIIIIIADSLAITILLLFILIYFLGKIDFQKGILNFLIGDDGSYSLSRLQAFIWGVIILTYQISVLLIFFKKNDSDIFNFYEISFSESTIWLLGLSLTSYVAVKAITVDKISKQPSIYKSISTPKISDLLTGDNGLDFSRCQMLIWTIIGIFVFLFNCYAFDKKLMSLSDGPSIQLHMNNFYEEYSAKDPKRIPPFVPYLPWSFIVLMGLSQGVYVGKKLVPTFKLDDIKNEKQTELKSNIEQLEIKKKLLVQILGNVSNVSTISVIDQANTKNLQDEIDTIQKKIIEITSVINEIDQYKK